ncbi:hypothetical protein V490_09109, partial [Pseudogymnoascus sp. VKM F-3557]
MRSLQERKCDSNGAEDAAADDGVAGSSAGWGSGWRGRRRLGG